MRVGEVVRLEQTDVHFSDGLLVVRCSKANKSRLVPLMPSTLRAFSSYALSPEASTFFVSSRGCAVKHESLRAGSPMPPNAPVSHRPRLTCRLA
jgi:site-specific recombinase XerD